MFAVIRVSYHNIFDKSNNSQGEKPTAKTAVAAKVCAVVEGRRPPPISTIPPTAVSPVDRGSHLVVRKHFLGMQTVIG